MVGKSNVRMTSAHFYNVLYEMSKWLNLHYFFTLFASSRCVHHIVTLQRRRHKLLNYYFWGRTRWKEVKRFEKNTISSRWPADNVSIVCFRIATKWILWRGRCFLRIENNRLQMMQRPITRSTDANTCTFMFLNSAIISHKHIVLQMHFKLCAWGRWREFFANNAEKILFGK